MSNETIKRRIDSEDEDYPDHKRMKGETSNDQITNNLVSHSDDIITLDDEPDLSATNTKKVKSENEFEVIDLSDDEGNIELKKELPFICDSDTELGSHSDRLMKLLNDLKSHLHVHSEHSMKTVGFVRNLMKTDKDFPTFSDANISSEFYSINEDFSTVKDFLEKVSNTNISIPDSFDIKLCPVPEELFRNFDRRRINLLSLINQFKWQIDLVRKCDDDEFVFYRPNIINSLGFFTLNFSLAINDLVDSVKLIRQKSLENVDKNSSLYKTLVDGKLNGSSWFSHI